MAARARLAGLLNKASLVLVLLTVLAAALCVPGLAAASSSPAAAAAEDAPFVNWTWLAVGLGGALLLLVGMWVMTRLFVRKKEEE